MENILVWALAGFAAVVVMFQAVPAVITFVGMVKGVLAPSAKTVKI